MHPVILALCCLVGGHVRTPTGAPIAHARVVVSGATHAVTLTDARGAFTLHLAPNHYRVTASAPGYSTVSVTADIRRASTVAIVLEPNDSPKLRVIGAVHVNGEFTLVRNAIPEVDISRQDFERLGYTNILSGLAQVPSATITRPDGGAPTAPAVVSLRGPDPSEALVTLDGQVLNDGNTGDVDLSELPVAAFSSVNVTEGLGPSDAEGSNTFGGALNLVSLRPTAQSHVALSQSIGSYGSSQMWMNATGTLGKLGYALAGSNFQQGGLVHQNDFVVPSNNAPIDCSGATPNCPALTHLGSSIAARAGLVNLDYNFSQSADLGFRVFTLGDARDESSVLNGIAGNAYEPCDPNALGCTSGFTTTPNPEYGMHVGTGNAIFAQSLRAYQAYARTPLGAGSLTAQYWAGDNTVSLTGGAGKISPYDVSHQDKRYNEQLAWGRTFDDSTFAVGGYLRQESLAGVGIDSTLAQSIGSYFARGATLLTRRLRLSGGLFLAHYSTFGNSLDWRLGTSYDLGHSSVIRAGVGTGFRAPLLLERYFFPPTVDSRGKVSPNPGLPPPDQNCVVSGQGNPNEQPEHATEYELGFSHLFSGFSSMDFSLYRSNLRDAIENYYPLGNFCNNPKYPQGFVYSYPINVGGAVYEGAEWRLHQRFPRQHLLMTLSYGLNVSYPRNLGANVSNPTSGGTLIDNQQFLGVPQQQGSIALGWADDGWHAGSAATFQGRNNALNQGPFTLVDAAVGYTFGHVDLTAAATNIFNADSGPFTYYLAGTPYRGLLGPNTAPYAADLPTNRLFVNPAAINLILTLHQ